jgi:hypothetical protein
MTDALSSAEHLAAPAPADSATGDPAASTLNDAALRAGCTPAYLAECIALGQLSPPDGEGLIDAGALATWVQQTLRPQQLALRAIVDAIDVMERRSMKTVVDEGACATPTASPPAFTTTTPTDHPEPLDVHTRG